MKVGDLIETNSWFPYRKQWNDTRIGLVLNKKYKDDFILGFEIMWLDNRQIEWEAIARMNQGSRWMRTIK